MANLFLNVLISIIKIVWIAIKIFGKLVGFKQISKLLFKSRIFFYCLWLIFYMQNQFSSWIYRGVFCKLCMNLFFINNIHPHISSYNNNLSSHPQNVIPAYYNIVKCQTNTINSLLKGLNFIPRDHKEKLQTGPRKWKINKYVLLPLYFTLTLQHKQNEAKNKKRKENEKTNFSTFSAVNLTFIEKIEWIM